MELTESIRRCSAPVAPPRAGRSSKPAEVTYLRFKGIGQPIALVGCGHLVAPLSRALAGWPFAVEPASNSKPVLTIRRRRGGYRLSGRDFDGEADEPTAVSAVCSIVVELVQARLAEDRSLLCLHCAAVAIDGRLAVFPALQRSGKSTFAARLAAGGARLFADDLLPVAIEPARGIALGAAPRLRLPLPERAALNFRRFVAQHAGPSDGYYCYLDLPVASQATFGEAAPLGAFVLLDRREGAVALEPVDSATLLQLLVHQNVALTVPANEILERLAAIAATIPAFRLRYDNVEAAAAMVEDLFRRGDAPLPTPAADRDFMLHIHGAADAPRDARAGLRRAAKRRWRRRPSIAERQIDGAVYLIDPEDDAIFGLDPIGGAVWSLLAEPCSSAEAAAELAEILTGAPPLDRLHADIAQLFEALAERRLIEPDA